MSEPTWEDQTNYDDEKDHIYYVGVYLVDLVFGGREEGGWWFQCGELVKDVSIFKENGIPLNTSFTDRELAVKYAETVQEKLNTTINVGRRDISSVLSEGQYSAVVMEDSLPTHFPEKKPHYE